MISYIGGPSDTYHRLLVAHWAIGQFTTSKPMNRVVRRGGAPRESCWCCNQQPVLVQDIRAHLLFAVIGREWPTCEELATSHGLHASCRQKTVVGMYQRQQRYQRAATSVVDGSSGCSLMHDSQPTGTVCRVVLVCVCLARLAHLACMTLPAWPPWPAWPAWPACLVWASAHQACRRTHADGRLPGLL